MNPDAVVAPAPPRAAFSTWSLALLPLALVAALIAVIVNGGPSRWFKADGVPPVERLAITRATLAPERITLSVLNDGPDPVTIAQVMVDDAFWMFEASPGTTVMRLGRTELTIPYPWVRGEPHVVTLLTSSGQTFEHSIAVAVETPRITAGVLGVFTLIGLYVGVIPVALGLIWYPLLGRLGTRGLQFLMALTIGLLAFLFVDATADGLEAARLVPGALQGPALFVFGALAAFLGLDFLGAWLQRRRQRTAASPSPAWVLALLIAIGIGLHNFGEGLAIGSAFALGELSLGTLLIVGFALHNTTEGIAIVAPLARSSARVPGAALVRLGLIGGVPTIVGAWAGGLVNSPVIAVLCLALGVGGIAQVTRQILTHSAGERGVAAYLRDAHVAAGLVAGVLLMYVTALVIA